MKLWDTLYIHIYLLNINICWKYAHHKYFHHKICLHRAEFALRYMTEQFLVTFEIFSESILHCLKNQLKNELYCYS